MHHPVENPPLVSVETMVQMRILKFLVLTLLTLNPIFLDLVVMMMIVFLVVNHPLKIMVEIT